MGDVVVDDVGTSWEVALKAAGVRLNGHRLIRRAAAADDQ